MKKSLKKENRERGEFIGNTIIHFLSLCRDDVEMLYSFHYLFNWFWLPVNYYNKYDSLLSKIDLDDVWYNLFKETVPERKLIKLNLENVNLKLKKVKKSLAIC